MHVPEGLQTGCVAWLQDAMFQKDVSHAKQCIHIALHLRLALYMFLTL